MQNVHAAFAVQNSLIIEVAPSAGPLHTELCVAWPGDSLKLSGGYLVAPTAPGLGVKLTDDIKRRFPFIPGSGEYNTTRGKSLSADDRMNIVKHDLAYDGFWRASAFNGLGNVQELGYGDIYQKVVVAVACADSRGEVIKKALGEMAEIRIANTGANIVIVNLACS